MVIDFQTRRRLDAEPQPFIEIVGWDNPLIRRDILASRCNVIIEGEMPLEMALRLTAMELRT